MAIDDNGTGLWTTGHGHGDALHVGDLDPEPPRPGGLQVDEDTDAARPHCMPDARTGPIIWSAPGCGCDNGRGVSDDIYAGSPGAEILVRRRVAGLVNTSGGQRDIGRKPGSTNFLVWWDGDPLRELLDGTHDRQVRHRRRHPRC